MLLLNVPRRVGQLPLVFFAGIEGIGHGLARDLAPIRVNVVSLGAVETELWQPMKEDGSFEGLKAHLEKGMLTGKTRQGSRYSRVLSVLDEGSQRDRKYGQQQWWCFACVNLRKRGVY